MQFFRFYTFIAVLFFIGCFQVNAARIEIRIVVDEAEAVLAVLEKRKTNQTITDFDWQKIFSSEGYARLKKREFSLKRSFADEDFKKFVLSDDLLERFESLRKTLAVWKKANVQKAANSALNYLPETAQIRAKIYPVIKPRENSFVFEIKENPAIFLYLDPSVTQQQFENTLAHEFHHIGFGAACPKPETEAEIKKLSAEKQAVLQWASAFGEGLAMLAAAGDADAHPHKFSKAKDRERWERDVKNFDADLKKVEAFFADVLAKRLTGDKIRETGFSFFGVQGAWYTVGWKMSVVIEKTFGRKKLIEAFCDSRKLLPTFNEAAVRYNARHKENLVSWSNELLESLK
jgi:hypothetical protein